MPHKYQIKLDIERRDKCKVQYIHLLCYIWHWNSKWNLQHTVKHHVWLSSHLLSEAKGKQVNTETHCWVQLWGNFLSTYKSRTHFICDPWMIFLQLFLTLPSGWSPVLTPAKIMCETTCPAHNIIKFKIFIVPGNNILAHLVHSLMQIIPLHNHKH